MAEKDLQEQAIPDNAAQTGQEAPNDGAAAGFDLNTDENQRGTTHLNEPVAEESAAEKLKAELQESKDKYLRLMAEFENYKRRSNKEYRDITLTAGKEIIVQMLDVIDDADRAQKQLDTTDDVKLVKEGVSLVFNKLRNTLQSKGLKAMETIGTEFDADLHEAITEIPVPDENMKGKVVDEVVKGYYLNDKIIRHAKVVVGK
ncbi:MAG: nucleotide exchange factor GrpE [Chitinophagaceae bacterium]|nr:MAG: nucleotide exchange factor GrpE [Chitinophagaceae bacterium]